MHHLRHSALTHDAETGASTPMLMAKSGHTSLARYARPSAEALARWQESNDPARYRLVTEVLEWPGSLEITVTGVPAISSSTANVWRDEDGACGRPELAPVRFLDRVLVPDPPVAAAGQGLTAR